jgi:hypothetical protein
MLTKSRMKIQPFIVSYRPAAIAAVVFLFLLEIVSILMRAFGYASIPKIISQMELVSTLIYVIVSVVLATCYIICAIGIWKRLQMVPGARKGDHSSLDSHSRMDSSSADSTAMESSESTTPRRKKRFKLKIWKKKRFRSVNRMTIRMVASSAGYILFIISCIFFAVWYAYPWGRMIPLNLTFIAHNWAATMQLLATRPRKRQTAPSDKFGSSGETNTYSQSQITYSHAASSAV